MHVIGIVGGVASGKSTVSDLLRELGAVVLNADQAGHQVLKQPEVVEAIQNRWGIDVIQPDGAVDRAAVAARVFGEVSNAETERQFLESLTHPRIRELLMQQIEAARLAQREAVVVDAPLLFEGGWSEVCDTILFVDAPLDVRRERAAGRGWGENELANRERFQLPLEEKKARSHVVIENGQDLNHCKEQVTRFWRQAIVGSLVD